MQCASHHTRHRFALGIICNKEVKSPFCSDFFNLQLRLKNMNMDNLSGDEIRDTSALSTSQKFQPTKYYFVHVSLNEKFHKK